MKYKEDSRPKVSFDARLKKLKQNLDCEKDSILINIIEDKWSPSKEYRIEFWFQDDLEWETNHVHKKVDFKFIWILRQIKYNRKFIIIRYEKALDDLEELKNLIDLELDDKE